MSKLSYKVKSYISDCKYRKERAEKGFGLYDLWEIDNWFFGIFPKILREYKERISSYSEIWGDEWYELNKERCEQAGITEDKLYLLGDGSTELGSKLGEELYQYNKAKWEETLDRMIFLFEEVNEETCSKKNPYEKELLDYVDSTILNKGKTKEEILQKRNTEAYSRLVELYWEEQDKIKEYQTQCKDEALKLFVKYIKLLDGIKL